MISGRMKEFFFDRQLVMNAVDRGTRNVLRTFGAFVRTAARSSIRPRKRRSSPGSPPSSHVGTLRKFIYFAFDPASRSVIIGPEKTNQVFFGGSGRPVRGTAPEILEEGGEETIVEVQRNGRWDRINLTSRRGAAGLPTRRRKVTIAARPYMHPAFEAEKKQLPALWANSIKP